MRIGHGARATEALLLELVAGLRDDARRDPRLLARPVRIIVPSRSLRLHVAERITSVLGATAGVLVQTLFGTASEILGRTGREAHGGDALVELWARRLAAREPDLASAFAPFQDGYRGVSGTVRDLCDAGFEVEHLDAVVECLTGLALESAQRERAVAVVRTAARTLAETGHSAGTGRSAGSGRSGAAGRSMLLADAAEALRADPDRALPARAVLVHGFADATGRAVDLIEALARTRGATVLVDLPPPPTLAPALPQASDAGSLAVDPSASWTDRFRSRLAQAAPAPASPADARPPAQPAPPKLELFRAPGIEAEARAIAVRAQALVRAGMRPERIGVVARELGPYRAALRRHLDRLGVPFSGLAARAPLDGVGRRALALADLLSERERLPTDRWLDLVSKLRVVRPSEDGGTRDGGTRAVLRSPTPELRLGLRVLGAARLADVALLDPSGRLDERGLRLPVRIGVANDRARTAGPDDELEHGHAAAARPAIGFHARNARLATELLEAAIEAAARTVRRLERWPARAAFELHVAALERLGRSVFGWRATAQRDNQLARRIDAALGSLARALGSEPVSHEEFALFARRALVEGLGPPLGGQGGGVQVLGAMEARSRTFDHLFVCGIGRDEFPRVGREDPLLGDDARRALESLLPDIPIQARARDEDRYLFAQLVSSSPSVTLSWLMADDDGKPRVASPLIERLLGTRNPSEIPAVPPVFPSTLAQLEGGGPRTAYELGVLGGLLGPPIGGAMQRDDRLPPPLGDDHATHLARVLDEAASAHEGESLVDRALPEAGPGSPASEPTLDNAAVARARARTLAAFERGPFEPERLAPWLGAIGAQQPALVRPDPRTEPQFVTRFEALARCAWQALLGRFLRMEEAPDPLAALPKLERNLLGNIVHGVLEELVHEALAATEPASTASPEDARTNRPERTLADSVASAGRVVDWAASSDPAALEERIARQTHTTLRAGRTPSAGLVRTYVTVATPLVRNALTLLAREQAAHPGTVTLGAEVAAHVPLEALGLELRSRADLVQARPDGTLVLTDFKTGAVKSFEDFRDKDLPRGIALQAVAYALAAESLGREPNSRYLYLRAAAPTEEAEVAVRGERWKERVPPFTAALEVTLAAWEAGLFYPRFLDAKFDKAPQACDYCAYQAACLHGDSGAKRALREWIERDAESPLAKLHALDGAGRTSGRGGRS